MNILSKKSICDEKKVFKYTILIYYFLGLINISMFSYIPFLEKIAKVCRYITYISFIGLAFKHLYKQYRNDKSNLFVFIFKYFKSHSLLFLIGLVSFFIMLFTHNTVPIILVIVLWGSYIYNFDDFIVGVNKVHILFMFITIIASTLNIIPDIMIRRTEQSFRYSLGYIYPLEFMTHYLFIALMYLYIKKDKFLIKDFLIINFINLLIFKITDARTGFIIIIISTSTALLVNKINYKIVNTKRLKIINVIMTLLYCILPVALSVLYKDNSIMVKINGLLSNRLELAHNGIMKYGIAIFGKSIEWIGSGGIVDGAMLKGEYNFVDCAYVKILLENGPIFLLLIILGYIYISLEMINKKNIYGVIIIHSIMIISIMEARLIQVEINPFIFLLGPILMKDVVVPKLKVFGS